jgi:hypothetical protein
MSQIPTIPPEKLQEAAEAIAVLYEAARSDLRAHINAPGPITDATAQVSILLYGKLEGLRTALREFEKRAPLWIIGSSTPG